MKLSFNNLIIFWLYSERPFAELKKKSWLNLKMCSWSSRFRAFQTVFTDCVRFLLQPWIPPAHGFFLAPLPEVGWMRKTQWAGGIHGGSKNLTQSVNTGFSWLVAACNFVCAFYWCGRKWKTWTKRVIILKIISNYSLYSRDLVWSIIVEIIVWKSYIFVL